MAKVTFYVQENPMDNSEIEFAQIENEDGGFTSMLKSEYERQQAEMIKEAPAKK